jgi:hypothetical protein
VKLLESLRRRLAAKHRNPWPVGVLEAWRVQKAADREERRIGPPPPPPGSEPPKKAEWKFRDRQDDPALASFRIFPQVDPTPRVVDQLPHH